uniref:DUF4201 domain-containing protein n=1 Tax=Hydatigena taeniaeformis TaxID=6205 RepID=A0A0R3X2U8_HYDTA
LQRSLEAAQGEIFDLKRTAYDTRDNSAAIRVLQAESAATIEKLKQENRNARKRVDEVEAEFRLLKESQKSLSSPTQEDIMNQFFEWKRRLGLCASAETHEVFNAVNDRLDRALAYEARTNEADFAQQELKNQLRESHNSASELANRVEVLLAEKEALKREKGLWNTEKIDLMATRGLLEQRVAALERQLEEVRDRLTAETDVTRQTRLESQQLLLEKNSQKVQFTALVESLAATLSTVESPCAQTEGAVKERVTRLITELQSLKKTQLELEKKIDELGKQFEFQFTNGQTLVDELTAVKHDLETAHKAKERLQCEVDGFRLMHSKKQPTAQVCLKNIVSTDGKDDCPSCAHLHTTPLDLANHAPEWSDHDVQRVQHLCAECLVCLAMALRQRLQAVMTVAPDMAKRERDLTSELEKAKREMEEMHEKVLKIEHEKSEEYEKLEQMVSKLEALRQHQAKRIAGLQSKTQRQSTMEAQKDQQLSAAKNFLMENRQKQLRVRHYPLPIKHLFSQLDELELDKEKFIKFTISLLNFRNTLCRILGLDAWLTPNPEAMIIQRVQQILLNASAQSRTLYLTHPFASVPLSHPTVTAQPLPSLPGPSCKCQFKSNNSFMGPIMLSFVDEFLEDGVVELQNAPTQSQKVNFDNQKQGLNKHLLPRRPAVCARSQSARGRDTRKY